MLTQQTSIAFSGKIPEFYDSFLGPMFFEPYALDMADRISKLNAKNILELASGTGRLTKLLPAVAKGASITASDINPAMVNYGKNIAKDSSIKWMEVDATTLPFEDESFDCVVVQFGVMFYPDRAKAFKEAWRVLKPGGTFIFNCWDDIKLNPMPLITNEALHHFFPVDTPKFYTIPFSYFDEKVINADLKESGFSKVNIDIVKLKGYSKSAANAAQGLIKGTPTITAVEDMDADKVPDLLKYIEDRIAAEIGKENLSVPLQAKVVTAVK